MVTHRMFIDSESGFSELSIKVLSGFGSGSEGQVGRRTVVAGGVYLCNTVNMLTGGAAQHLLGVDAGVFPGSAAHLVVTVDL